MTKTEFEDAHIMIEFYMEQCRFCVAFKDIWNQVHDELSAKYNKDGKEKKKVAFFKVDGEKIHELRRRFRINSFPSFVYLRAGSKGK